MSVKARIRFDYKAEAGGNFLWWRRDLCQAAKEARTKQLSLLRNLPFQGLNVAELDPNYEVYLVPEDDQRRETAYAPLELIVEADSITDLMPLTLREEFRKIKVIEPAELHLSHCDVERFLFRVNEEYREGLQ